LVRGKSGSIAGDLSYTLSTSPNHHRALLAMMRLAEREKSPQASGARHSVECYFDRALRFRSDDTIPRLLYAQWLIKNKRDVNARAQLATAAGLAGDNAFTHYNIGLIYFDMKAYDQALVHAHKAMDLGLPRTELRERLRTVGRWTDSAAPTTSDSSASAASAASN
jgi:tetratricopeptide (TPR) repeat protein